MAKRAAKPKPPAKVEEPEFDAKIIAALRDDKTRDIALSAFRGLLTCADDSTRARAVLWYMERFIGKPHTNEGPNRNGQTPSLTVVFAGQTPPNGMFLPITDPVKRE